MSTITQAPPTGTWKLDPIHSTVGFSVRHLGVSTFRGSFRDFDAELAYGDGTPRLTGTADLAGAPSDPTMLPRQYCAA